MFVRIRPVLFVIVLALGSLVASPRAEAQDGAWSSASFGSWDLSPVLVPVAVVAGVIGVAELVLLAADVYSWAAGTPFDDGWAVVDLVVGSLWTIAGAAILLADTGSSELAMAGAGTGLALGAVHIAHGAWSMATNDPRPPITPGVAVSAEGVTFTLAGAF